jgi:phosphoenolpyruvate carboxykinase (ATP)
LLSAALDDTLATGTFRADPNFGFEVPTSVPGVADLLLEPRRTWEDKEAYDAQAEKLVTMFSENFKQYLPHIDEDVRAIALGA